MRLLLLALLLVSGVQAKPLIEFDTQEDELKDGQERLKELEQMIRRRDIPPIEFEFDKAILKDSSKEALEFVAELLQSHASLKLMVFGHTCDIGTDEYNLWLSQKRAEAVKTYLVKLGVMGEFVRAKGYGESKPRHSNETEDGRIANRRVEFVLTTRWWESVY